MATSIMTSLPTLPFDEFLNDKRSWADITEDEGCSPIASRVVPKPPSRVIPKGVSPFAQQKKPVVKKIPVQKPKNIFAMLADDDE